MTKLRVAMGSIRSNSVFKKPIISKRQFCLQYETTYSVFFKFVVTVLDLGKILCSYLLN